MIQDAELQSFEDKVQTLAREVCIRIELDQKYWRQYAGQIREKLIADAVADVIARSKTSLLNETKS